jgi:glycosyltransferase involved in cell wall biosynthesis
MVNNTAEVSVLIALCANDNPLFFKEAMNSIFSQSMEPAEIVLVLDGPLLEGLSKAVSEYKDDKRVKIVRLETNNGLACALNEGLKSCSYDIVIRADSDDINIKDRIETQFRYFTENRDIDVLGGWVLEYTEDMKKIISIRKVPEWDKDIKRKMKRRNCINHPASAFRKSSITKAGGYPSFRKSQDYALWSKMISEGFAFHNLQKVLVKMRCGKEMMRRRGLRYFYHEFRVLKFQKKIGFINAGDFLLNLIIRFIFRMVPVRLRLSLYRLIRIRSKQA